MIPEFPIFKNLELDDKKEIEVLTDEFNPYSDFNFTCLWIWDYDNEIQISKLNNNLVILFRNHENGRKFLSFIGKNSISQTASTLINFSKTRYKTDYLKFIPDEIARELPKAKFEKIQDRNCCDYIYFIPNLAQMEILHGSSLGKKIRHFLKMYPHYRIVEYHIQKAPKKECERLFYKWADNKHIGNCPETQEYKAFQRLFKLNNDNIRILCLYLNKALIGFTVYEILANDFVMSHFAKSDNCYHRSINHILNWEEAKFLNSKGIKHSNWEDDLGLMGLREYKLEYRPCYFLEKFIIKFSPTKYEKLKRLISITNYLKTMDKKSKVLLVIFVLAVIASVGITFYNTVILKDFEIVESDTTSQEL